MFKVGFAGKTTDAVFIPADVGARLRPLVTDIYGADGAKSLLNRLAPMVDDQMLHEVLEAHNRFGERKKKEDFVDVKL